MNKPFTQTVLIRILLVVIVVLSLVAGYYHGRWQVETRKNQQLIKLVVKETRP